MSLPEKVVTTLQTANAPSTPAAVPIALGDSGRGRVRSGRTREAARCMDFAVPPVHVLGCQILCDFYTCTTGFEKAWAQRLESARHLERP